MAVRFNADAVTGKFAIYTGNDDLPMNNPLSYVSRVKHHSDLPYTRIVAENSGTLTLPARATRTFGTAFYPIMAHGRSGVPMVEVAIYHLGTWIALNGSVPVQQDYAQFRWLTAGADNTNVYINEYQSNATGYAAMSIQWRAYVTSEILV